MKGFKDHFSGHAEHYSKARPHYPVALFSWLAAQCEQTDRAWDCATGNGQAAVALATHFTQVVATDASETQIANAQMHPQVKYYVAPAETSGLDANSCDLVTVAQALHWFDHERFYTETRRVLKPGGVVVAWGYDLTRVSPEIDRVVDMFDQQIVGAYWPPERRHIDAHYTDLPFPFEKIAVPEFSMALQWNRKQFVNYLGTWSSVQAYRKARQHDPLVWLESELAAYWNTETMLEVTWPMFFLAGVAGQ